MIINVVFFRKNPEFFYRNSGYRNGSYNKIPIFVVLKKKLWNSLIVKTS